MMSTFGPNDENGVECAKYAVVEIDYSSPKKLVYNFYLIRSIFKFKVKISLKYNDNTLTT